MPGKKMMLPAQHFRADVAAQSVSADKREFEIVWTTGARVKRYDWARDTYYWEELSLDPAHVRMDFLKSGNAPVLNVHSAWALSDVLGIVRSADLSSPQSKATIKLSKRADVDPILQDVLDGIIRNASVGYKIHKMERLPPAEGDTIPIYRAIDWEPFEISLVPIGADLGAGVRSDDKAPKNECELINIVAENSGDQEERQMPPEITTEKPVTPAPAPTVDVEAAKREAAEQATATERKRVADISLAVRTAKLPESFAQELITSGVNVDEARKQIIDKWASAETPHNTRSQVVVVADATDKYRDGATAWIMQRAGVAHVVEQHTKTKLEAGEFRGMSLIDLARESLERQGVKTRGVDQMTLVGMALTHRSGMQSVSDFSVLLENALHKTLLAAYAITPDTWSRFCKKGSVSDFRPHPRYRQGTFGKLDKVLDGGELTNKAIPDAGKESVSADTYGNLIALSRKSIINDDMGAFADLAMRLGRAAKLSVEMDVYATLALNSGMGPTMSDGNPLFHASHSNISTGAALSSAAIDADRVVLASQKDPSGNEILDLRPAVLVLPIGLGGDARVFNDAQYDPDTANKLQKPNKVRGLFRDIVDSPRLSGTRRYMFADPAFAPVLEVSFLDGQENPFLEVKEGFKVDGVEWKVRLDYGVGGVDYRGGVTNAGA